MKAIVLAGGFAKRLGPLTKDTPKPLLPIGGKPMIDHIIEKLVAMDDVDSIIISTNSKFEPQFREWKGTANFGDHVEIFTEESRKEEEKIGAVGALGLLLKEKDIKDDVIVIAGDNIFEFNLQNFVSAGDIRTPKVALYDMKDKALVKSKYGVVIIDKNNIIREFHEKPENPPSTLVSTGCYFFPKGITHKIHEYLNEGQNPDAPGFFISWLVDHVNIHGFVFGKGSRWFDIGSIESYEHANRIYSKKS